MENRTSIQISRETKEKLDELKLHPREPYDELLQRMIEKLKSNQAPL